MKVRCFFFLLFTTLFLSGCASSLTPADKARIRRVGVVSLVGDSIRGSYVGLTVFNNEYYDAAVPDFALDQILETESAHSIGSGGVALPMERAALESAAKYRSILAGGAPYDLSRAKGGIQNIAAQRKLDAVAIWTPTVFEDYGMRLRGASLSAGTFGRKMGAGIYAVMDVYDGATGMRLARNVGNVAHLGGFGAADPGILDIRWRDKFEQFTPEERATIRSEFQRQARGKGTSAPRNLGIAR